jgi:acetyltransferase-like isoleucine patch superfamily enzyme
MKKYAKQLINGLCFIAIIPLLCSYAGARLLVGRLAAFQSCSQTLSLLPGISGIYLRRAFYRITLEHCASDSLISFGTTLSDPRAEIHRGVYIGARCSLGRVTLEDDVLISSNVSLLSGAHQHGTLRADIPIRFQPGCSEPIRIGTGAWVGERATVMASIGDHCVVGAGAVVTKPVPDFAVAVGVPAAVISYRNEERRFSCA